MSATANSSAARRCPSTETGTVSTSSASNTPSNVARRAGPEIVRPRRQEPRSVGPRMKIPTEPIGSLPRPLRLIEAVATHGGTDPALDPLYDEAIRDTIDRFEATGSPVVT